MKNIKYSIYGKNIIVTQDEHQQIMKAKESGNTIAILRNGTLGIPLTTNWLFQETSEPTDQQENSTRQFNLPRQLPPMGEINQEKKNKRVRDMIRWAKDNGLYKPVKPFIG